MPAHRRRSIFALLLATFDQANTLWPHPTQRARPRQLSTPSQFRENNIWLAMESAIDAWTQAFPPENSPLPVVNWPEQPPQSGGICVFEGRLKDLAGDWPGPENKGNASQNIQCQAAITALPRPNQAYWTLSALWSGWLWGRETAAPIKMVLRRRRYDWNWHCTALYAAFSHLKFMLKPGAAFLGLVGETEPGFVSAALIAASLAGLELEGLAMRTTENQAQIEWRQSGKDTLTTALEEKTNLAETIRDLIQQGGQDYLRRRGEPANYLEILSAGLSRIVSTGLPGVEIPTQPVIGEETSPAELLSLVNTGFQQALTFPAGFVRFHGSSSSLEIGQWWLCESHSPAIELEKIGAKASCRVVTQTKDIETPLADQIEIEVVRSLINQPSLDYKELERILANKFRGLFTPDPELVRAILESYADNISPDGELWRLRPHETPHQRRQDITSISGLLQQIGNHLGYDCTQMKAQRWILWRKTTGEVEYAFYPLASAVIGKLVSEPEYPAPHSLLVHPGGRAALLRYKLHRDARLQAFVALGWRFIKFRHVRRLLELEKLNIQALDEQLSLDPLANQDPQISFI